MANKRRPTQMKLFPEPKKPRKPKVTEEVKNEQMRMTRNGLADAILASAGNGAYNNGSIGVQLSQVDTLFKNLRWYLVSNMRQLLSELYVEIGLVQTIVDVPVDDGLRGGVTIKSKQLGEQNIQQLNAAIERENDLTNAGQAAKWNRLYGGAGVLILTGQLPETPLNIEAINPDSMLEFRAIDMWELYGDLQNTQGYDPATQQYQVDMYTYYSAKVHPSRVFKLTGMIAPSFIRPRLRGWGISVCEALVRSINQYLKATDLGFEVLDEFKLDIYKIKNLTNTLLSAQGDIAIRQRVQLANQQKNYQNAITMDAEDDYIQKQLSFAGLAETMAGIRMQVAADMRMPITKLFGISAAGFNSGEDDIEVYNSMVESQVRSKLKYVILQMIELRCQQLFGFVPDDLEIDFQPLRIMSSEQEENVKTQKFARLLQAKQSAEISSQEFRDACNRDDLLGIQLEQDAGLLDENDAEETTDDQTAGEEDDSEDPEIKEAKVAPKSSLTEKKAPEAKQ